MRFLSGAAEWVRRGNKDYDTQARIAEDRQKVAQELGKKRYQMLFQIEQEQKLLTELRGQLGLVKENASGQVDHQQILILEGSIRDHEKALKELEAEKKAFEEKNSGQP